MDDFFLELEYPKTIEDMNLSVRVTLNPYHLFFSACQDQFRTDNVGIFIVF